MIHKCMLQEFHQAQEPLRFKASLLGQEKKKKKGEKKKRHGKVFTLTSKMSLVIKEGLIGIVFNKS